MEKRKKILYANGYEKRAEVAMLISSKIAFKSKAFLRDKGGHYILNKVIYFNK